MTKPAVQHGKRHVKHKPLQEAGVADLARTRLYVAMEAVRVRKPKLKAVVA